MPRKMRVPKARRGSALRLRDFDPRSELCFVLAWRPPMYDFERARSRWATWREFLDDYLEVRAEALARWSARKSPIFAERVLAFAAAGGDEALARATYIDIRDYPVEVMVNSHGRERR